MHLHYYTLQKGARSIQNANFRPGGLWGGVGGRSSHYFISRLKMIRGRLLPRRHRPRPSVCRVRYLHRDCGFVIPFGQPVDAAIERAHVLPIKTKPYIHPWAEISSECHVLSSIEHYWPLSVRRYVANPPKTCMAQKTFLPLSNASMFRCPHFSVRPNICRAAFRPLNLGVLGRDRPYLFRSVYAARS